MRIIDIGKFQKAATQLKLYILVRNTNPASLDYIGKAGYIPKRFDCKAKTADTDYLANKKLAGLVVDPTIHPAAFEPKKLAETIQLWDKNVKKISGSQGRFGYTVDGDVNSKHYGCLMFFNSYIHGDYDLYDIVDPKHLRNNLALVDWLQGLPHRVGLHVDLVQKTVNALLGTAMVQHGSSAQYARHSDELIHAFCPNGEYKLIENLAQLQFWYNDTFSGRITLRDTFKDINKNPLNAATGGNIIRVDFKNKRKI
jgi:hypothetical protein